MQFTLYSANWNENQCLIDFTASTVQISFNIQVIDRTKLMN